LVLYASKDTSVGGDFMASKQKRVRLCCIDSQIALVLGFFFDFFALRSFILAYYSLDDVGFLDHLAGDWTQNARVSYARVTVFDIKAKTQSNA
jgi:hypothetical protein